MPKRKFREVREERVEQATVTASKAGPPTPRAAQQAGQALQVQKTKTEAPEPREERSAQSSSSRCRRGNLDPSPLPKRKFRKVHGERSEQAAFPAAQVRRASQAEPPRPQAAPPAAAARQTQEADQAAQGAKQERSAQSDGARFACRDAPAGEPLSKRALRRALQDLRRYCDRCNAAVRADNALGRNHCFCGGILSQPEPPRHGKHPGRLDAKAQAALLLLQRFEEEQRARTEPVQLRAEAAAMRARAAAHDSLASLQEAQEAWKTAEQAAAAAETAARPPTRPLRAAAQPADSANSEDARTGLRASGTPQRGTRGGAQRKSRQAKTLTWQQRRR